MSWRCPADSRGGPAMQPAHKMVPAVANYKASCGTIYLAADAKRPLYSSSMDNSKLVAVEASHK